MGWRWGEAVLQYDCSEAERSPNFWADFLGAELNIVMKRGSSIPSRLPSRAIKLHRINSYPHARYEVLYFTSDETLKRSFFWVILMWCEQYSNVYQMSEITLLTLMDSVCVYLGCVPNLSAPPSSTSNSTSSRS